VARYKSYSSGLTSKMDMTGLETVAGLRTGLLSRREKRRGTRANLLLLGASALAVACSYGGIAQAAPKLKVLYSFANVRGTTPLGNLITDNAGNLYGTAYLGGANGYGAVFELSPPLTGKKHWTQTVLHFFNGAKGNYPYGGLIADGAGNFYGTTNSGGLYNAGTVYELSPPVGGKKKWTETVLFSFNGTDGSQPGWGLIADGAGNLYGTTNAGGSNGDGAVFELSPPKEGKKAWTESVLVSFNGTNGNSPFFAGLSADGAGNLYGTTSGGGSNNDGLVFELSPPAQGQTAWTETVLFSFAGSNGSQPHAGVIADGAGNLYGTTYIGGSNNTGVVFELSPPAQGQTAWTETVLQNFTGTNGSTPFAALIVGGGGNLYGTTLAGGANGYGIVYELSPPAKGQTAWTETVLQSFTGANGSSPAGGVVADGAGNLYGTADGGGANSDGVVFKVTP
jgi:uncharacterized repeat protein (TIGR03803 family)